MKTISKKAILLSVVFLVSGVMIGWLIFGGSKNQPNTEHNHTINESMDTIWTCSMHPQIRRSEPGDCPICGMNLIPLVDSESDIDPMAISMSPTAMQLANVQTMIVETGNANKSIILNGKVQADERLLFTQTSHIPGRIEKLTVNFTGEFIHTGQTIAFVYSPELVTAQEELFEAYKMQDAQPALFQAAKEKLKNWKLSEGQINSILESKTVIKEFPIVANVSGIVTEKFINLGDYIKQGQAMYEITDLSKVWILFDVYESEMPWIKKGDKISFNVQSVPGKTYSGIISFIDPVIHPNTRVAKARVEFSNTDLILKPEMFVSGNVISKISTKSGAIIIPKTALMWTGKRSVVYVKGSTSQQVNFMMREITLGPTLGDGYIVESGLEPGEEIVVNGTFSVDAAAQLAGKPSMMRPEGGATMSGHNHGKSNNLQPTNTIATKNTGADSEDVRKALQPMFNNYFEMKTALTNDEFENAKEAGKKMYTALRKIDMNIFNDDAHLIWMKQSSFMNTSLQHIEHVSDIKKLRENFQSISNAMIVIAEAFKPMLTTVYIQHCPMADSNKGADWLSKEKEILNPYFGQSMLSCGEITKTLK